MSSQPSPDNASAGNAEDLLIVGGRTFRSRLLIGTGKYKDFEETQTAIEATGAEVVTLALRRTNIGQNPDEPNLLDFISPDKYTICLLYTSPSPRDAHESRMPSSA